MEFDRSLIKSQARNLIKGSVFKFFIICFVVILLTETGFVVDNITELYQRITGTGDIGYSDFYDFGSNGSGSGWDSGYFDGFKGMLTLTNVVIPNAEEILDWLSGVLSIVNLFLVPLLVTLAGVFVQFVRGQRKTMSQYFSYLFSNAFDSNYWKKFGLYLSKFIIIGIMTCLLIVPGVIFYYKYYFAEMIMADKPNISPGQALRLSDKITRGHKTELFMLDLSFLLWLFLCIITCGIMSIYVMPYYMTTKALYYENFRIRASVEGKITEYDFLTDKEKLNEFAQNIYGAPINQNYNGTYNQVNNETFGQYSENTSQQPYYTPPENDFGSGQGTDYYNSN